MPHPFGVAAGMLPQRLSRLSFGTKGWLGAGGVRNQSRLVQGSPQLESESGNSSHQTRRQGLSSLPKSRFAYPEGVVDYEDDYTEVPEYPQIDPETHAWNPHKKERRQKVLNWFERIQRQPNPEAKNLVMNMPRMYGWRSFILKEDLFDYDSEAMYRFLTRTCLVDNALPDVYESGELVEQAKYFAEKVKTPFLEALQFELNEQRRREDPMEETRKSAEFKRSQSIVSQLNRVILSVLGKEVEHLRECQVDHAPKLEAFWLIGGQSPNNVERGKRRFMAKRKGHSKYTGKEDDPKERAIQYRGSPLLQVRHAIPLKNYLNENDPLCSQPPEDPVNFPYHPATYAIARDFNYASLNPGTWTGDDSKCSHIAFHSRYHLLDDAVQNSQHWLADSESSLASQAMLSSFGRLLAQALYFGFDQFSGLNYPFSGQTVITDGTNWTFSCYQLNTIGLGELHLPHNKKRNICWKTNTKSIFDEKDNAALDMQTLELLLKFYLNKPMPIQQANPTPYLKEPLQSMEDEIEKEIIFVNFRDMVSQRYIRHNLYKRTYPEIYDWEWIYKIRHPSRHMDARRRFFELPHEHPNKDPYNTPYKLLNPRLVRKRMKFLMEEVAQQKEAERLAEAKRLESAKYGVVYEDPKKKK